MRMLMAALAAALLACPAPGPAADDGGDYRVLAADGPTDTDRMLDGLARADVTVLGESHRHPVGHAVELRVLQGLHARHPRTALSLEMFERDVQLVVDEYLRGHITEAAFLAAARPWPGYSTDYRPLVEYCRTHGLPVVAANVPRRYVNLVGRMGQGALLALPGAARRFLPRLPYSMDLPAAYEAELVKLFDQPHGSGAGTGAPGTANMIQAQGLWDAGMAAAVRAFRRGHAGWKVLHINGSMHSDNGHGVVARLRRAEPRWRVRVVSIKPDKEYPAVDAARYRGVGDFVVVTGPVPTGPPPAAGR